MTKKGETPKEDLETIHRSVEEEPENVARTTMSDRQTEVRRTPEDVMVKEGAAARKYETDREKGAQQAGKESQGRSCCEMQRDVWKENTEKKALDRIVCRWQFHGGQRIMEEKEFQRHCDEVYVDP